MKLTDLALIFIAILLPIVMIVYVNTSFVIRAEREEVYYKNLITSAVADATIAMKEVENEDYKIDYGYSGIVDNKVSINANIAVDTFFTSLYNNMGITGNKASEEQFKSYIPAIAVIDYDGIYIYSAEEYDGEIKYMLKPKKYFTYMYYFEQSMDGSGSNVYQMKEYTKDSNIKSNQLIYQVTFTQDDYIYLKVYQEEAGKIKDISDKHDIQYTSAFYLTDSMNNDWLVGEQRYMYSLGTPMTSTQIEELKKVVIKKLDSLKKEVIAKICMQELSYAVNAHNIYARQAGIKYNFVFGIESDEQWYETVDGIGMVAVVQGISLGNRYLNYSAYSVSDLALSKKYYLSQALGEESKVTVELLKDYIYYHMANNCPLYEEYMDCLKENNMDNLVPSFLYNKEEAAANGFKPCFVCKP